MSDLIKKIKIKKQDGTYTDYIPIGAEAKNVDCSDGESVEYKLNKKPYYYNSVADMKADTNLKVGDMAITLGYYEANDGGGAEYKIVKNIIINNDYYEELNNSYLAKLLINNETEINVKQIGIYGDGIHDDTQKISQLLLKDYPKIYFPSGIYNITGSTLINDNEKILSIKGDKENKTKFNITFPEGTVYYYPFEFRLFKKIDIKQIYFKGNNFTTTETLQIPKVVPIICRNGQSVTIEDCYFEDVSIAYHSQHNYDDNNQYFINEITLKNLKAKDGSIDCLAHLCNSDNILVENCSAKNLIDSGKGSGSVFLYLRPNIKNLIVSNCYIEGCTGDVLHFNRYDDGIPSPSDFTKEPNVKTLFVNNICKNIGNLVGFNSYTEDIVVSNNIIDGVNKRIISAFNGKLNHLKFINNKCLNYNNLINLENAEIDPNNCTGIHKPIESIEITNNSFINKISGSPNLLIRGTVDTFIFNNNYLKEYQAINITSPNNSFLGTIKNIFIEDNIWEENVSSSNYVLLQPNGTNFDIDNNNIFAVNNNKTTGESRINVFIFSPAAIPIMTNNNILQKCSNFTTGNIVIIGANNYRNGNLIT